ncbi:MAG: hypothetical protein P8X98_04635 [Woeseiaceae bacterium]|jgi:uncharacterized protein YjbJ (UPF0337 family)
MRKASKLALIVFAAAFAVACEDKGPAEKAGEKIDEAMSEAKDKAEEAGDAVKDAADDAGDAIEEAADDVEEKLTDD